MATWGKKSIELHSYYPPETLYYEYSTVTDTFYFRWDGTDDYSGKPAFNEYLINDDLGRAMMEAFIHHVKAMDGLTEEAFMERYIKNNRYAKEQKT